METNIPIYRAKKIDSDEYIEGQYLVYKGYPAIFNEYGLDGVDVDDATLSIHFPDMIDSQGNKIFASLQEDGKGGDICEYKDWDSDYEDEFLNKGICLFEGVGVFFTNRNEVEMEDLDFKYDVKAIGIQQ